MLFTKPKNASARGRGRSGGIERTKKAQLRSKGSWEADGRRVCFERARRAEDALVARQARGSTAGKGSWKVDALRIRFERVGCEKTRAAHATESRGARRCGRESKVRVRAFDGLTAKRGLAIYSRRNRVRRALPTRGACDGIAGRAALWGESKVRDRASGGLTAKRGGPGCARSNRARRAPSKRGGPRQNAAGRRAACRAEGRARIPA